MTTLNKENAEATLIRKIGGIEIIKATDIKDVAQGRFFVIYGQGGAGKTTLAGGAAEIGPTLEIDCEGGGDVLQGENNVDIVPCYSWRDFEKVTKELLDGDHGYKNVIVDNVSELVNLDLLRISGKDQPEIQEWGEMTRDILHKTREYRDAIARKQGVNVFFLAWDADEKDDKNVVKKDISFTPALRKEFPGVVTIIGHLGVTRNPALRVLSFAPGPKTIAKFRRAKDTNAQKIPFDIYYGVDNLPMADILRTMNGEQKWPSAKYPTPERRGTRGNKEGDAEDED